MIKNEIQHDLISYKIIIPCQFELEFSLFSNLRYLKSIGLMKTLLCCVFFQS